MPSGSGFTGFPGYRGPGGGGQGSVSADGYGGNCITMLAAAALAVGDAVYISAADHVNKGATANLAATMGVVVGGKITKGRCYPEMKIGDAAASAAEDWVIVCVQGKCRVVSDAAVAAGASLGFGGTAGRLDDITTDATSIIGLRIGKSLTAAGGAATEFDAWIELH
jgi:hypothetical protein